ncbi:hypothetical protein H0H92_003660 [Tricholoma furcatifolium]|nr:hypothetical protein H0H92_003660 [Tricholoma furcatifolium]
MRSSKKGSTTPSTPAPRSLRARPEPAPPPPAKPRRTSEQVQADNALKAQEKLDKSKAREKTIADVAHLEDLQQQEDLESARHANHPPSTAQKKATRPISTISKRSRLSSAPDLPANAIDKPVEDSQDMDTDQERLANSDDEVEISTGRKTHEPSSKGTGGLRGQVNSARGQSMGDVDKGDSNKRKAPSEQLLASTTIAAKKHKSRKAGLRQGWNNDSESPQVARTQHSRSASTGSAMSITTMASQNASTGQSTSTTSTSTNLMAANEVLSDQEELPRGISDDEGETVERKALVEEARPQRRGVVGSKVASLAAVVSTSSVAEFVPPSKALRRGSHGLRKADIRLKHLPFDVRNKWESKFSPRVIEFIGTLKPWAALSTCDKEVILKIWADVFPTETALEEDSSLFFIVMKLIGDVTAAWQHKFSATAEKFLTETIFKDLEDDREVRAMWCTWALGTDMSPEQRAEQPQGSLRFYYGRYEEPDEDVGGRIHASGIFQSPIVAATMATHYAWLDKLESSYRRLEAPPIGALVLTIQACRHNISQWLTGSKVKPPGQLANFAASNWADRKDRDGPFNIVDSRLTSDILDVVDQIKPKKWESIAKAAREYVRTMKSKGDQEQSPSDEPRLKRTFKLIDDDDSEASDHARDHSTGSNNSPSFTLNRQRYHTQATGSSLRSSSGSSLSNFAGDSDRASSQMPDRSTSGTAGSLSMSSAAAAATVRSAVELEAGMSSEPEHEVEEEPSESRYYQEAQAE